MSYVEKHLMDGETVVYVTRLHWIVLAGPLILALLLSVPGIALLVLSGMHAGDTRPATESMLAGGVILTAIALIIFVRGILNRNATEMAVTNKRVVAKVGVAARRTVEMILSRVESIGVEETVVGRMLGYGTVIVRGTGGTPESFDKIAHPLEFRTQVQQQIDRSQDKS
jgi:uncharacterized membrane protein YdbT with pleckstrin-like domain